MLCERRVASSGQEVVTSLNTAIDRREEVGNFLLELQTEVHTKARNHGECPYLGLLQVEINTTRPVVCDQSGGTAELGRYSRNFLHSFRS